MYILAYILAYFWRPWFQRQPRLQSLCNAFAVPFCLLTYMPPKWQDSTPHSGEEGGPPPPTYCRVGMGVGVCPQTWLRSAMLRELQGGHSGQSFDYVLSHLIKAGEA